MLCKGSERRSPSLLLYKRDSGWVLSSDVRPGCCRMALTGLAIASLAHLQPPLGEVRSPQSSSGHAKTRMHHRTERRRLSPASLQACPREKHRAKHPDRVCLRLPGVRPQPLDTALGQLPLASAAIVEVKASAP